MMQCFGPEPKLENGLGCGGLETGTLALAMQVTKPGWAVAALGAQPYRSWHSFFVSRPVRVRGRDRETLALLGEVVRP